MTTSQIFADALALSPPERASIALTLLQSLPEGPRVFRTEEELAEELNRRFEAIESGEMATYDAADTIRRVRESLASKPLC